MSEATDRPTRTEKPQISKQIYMGVISSDSLSKMPESTYLIVDSCIMVVLFYLISAFLFSRFPIISPGTNQNLSERKIKPDLEYDRV